MNDDYEELRLVGEAAGLKILRDPQGIARNCTGMATAMNIFAAPVWDPRAIDGDAFRLLVKFGILGSPRFPHFLGMERFGRQEADDLTAYRHAIWRTALEIAVFRSANPYAV